MFDKARLVEGLEALAESALEKKDLRCGSDIDLRIDRSRLQDCARLLLQHEFYLSFLTAVHVSPACELVYQFGHFEAACRILLRVSAGQEASVPSLAGIYQGADWHEREVHDFFGITFPGHSNLKPLILTREERDFKPLRKSPEHLKSFSDIFTLATRDAAE